MKSLFSSRKERKREQQLRLAPAAASEDPSHLPPEYLSIFALSKSSAGLFLYVALSILSCGILALVGRWYPEVRVRLMRKRARSFREAEFVIVKGRNGRWTEIEVRRDVGLQMFPSNGTDDKSIVEERAMIWFEYRKQRYIYQEAFSSFQRHNPRLRKSCIEIHQLRGGLSEEEASVCLNQNGPNHIDIDDLPIINMLLDKVIHPFYLFQVLSVIVWMLEAYYTYALLILIMSCSSIAWEMYSAKQNEKNLRNLVKVEHICRVIRDGRTVELPAAQLVVGDAVILKNIRGAPVVADMALVQGECVTDESTLTGESVPVVKTQLPFVDAPGNVYSPDRHKSNTLFAGSVIVEVKVKCDVMSATSPRNLFGEEEPQSAIAIVTSTGFASTKGELFRSILFPDQIEFKFYRDAYKFLAILGMVAVAAFINRLIYGLRNRLPSHAIVLSCLDLITIAVPPALPLILTIGIGFSLDRLKRQSIFCIDPERINLAGRVNIMAFDKTGTLTESSLKWAGIEAANDGMFVGFSNDAGGESRMERVLATCHGINNVHERLVGHPVDVEMFRVTGWSLDQKEQSTHINGQPVPLAAVIVPPEADKPTYHILRRFEFDAHLQKSSIVAIAADGASLFSCTKGSPEAIRNICRQESIPMNFHAVYRRYAAQGYYVIACATKELTGILSDEPTSGEIANLRREQVERDVMFAGFILLQNQVKEESIPTIAMLREAHIRSIIITGDNALTAIHVARQLDLCRKVLLIDVHEDNVIFTQVQDEPDIETMSLHSATPRRHVSTGSLPSLQRPEEFAQAAIAPDATEDERSHPIEDLTRHLTHVMDQVDIAVTGAALDAIIGRYEATFANWLAGRARIFSRTKPSQKTWIVERLKRQGNYVGMCGDGTNDCGALKAAHVGLALSDAEASIVSPFTSARKSVSDVEKLFREGRCALETSFTAFKVLLVATLYQLGTDISNNQFLFDDLAIVLALSLLMLYTGPALHLERDRPTDDLFSPIILVSIGGQFLINVAFLIACVAMLLKSHWFCSVSKAAEGLDETFRPINSTSTNFNWACYPIDPVADIHDTTISKSYENTVLWLYTHFQFAICALAFSITSTYRRPFWTNTPYATYLLLLFCILTGMLLSLGRAGSGYEFMARLFDLRTGVPDDFRFAVWCIAMANLGCALIFEAVVVNGLVRKWVARQEDLKKQAKDLKRERSVGIGVVENTGILDVQTGRWGGAGGSFGRIMSFGWWGTIPEEDRISHEFEMGQVKRHEAVEDFYDAEEENVFVGGGSEESLRLVGAHR
ncbi:hypothetical protein SpCBS45565_g04019 [Spizellomyces sp. 'palustris']|nr:hypothetical protein SpCBS45565_g04019 [Spizellomyces sp. 'palustris']